MGNARNPQGKLAIIGGGPGGLVAAKYAQAWGFSPTVFEQSAKIGGQWNTRAAHSGVWPLMSTNTSRAMTCFSDFSYKSGVPIYPSEQDVASYLNDFAIHYGLLPHIRLDTHVDFIDRAQSHDGWCIHTSNATEGQKVETFPYVIVASGRYNAPAIPSVRGLKTFNGSGGVSHTFDFQEPERFHGLRVLVVGGSISALEIASYLAMRGSVRVISAYRRQRYILPKIAAGISLDHVTFTRIAVLAAEVTPTEIIARRLKEFVMRLSGSPEKYGALMPADNLLEAGTTASQTYLPLVAEGRIVCKPWIDTINGQIVRFHDGSEEEVDAIIFGTGYNLHLPFLSDHIRKTINIDDRHMDLYRLTFHPELTGLAFLGIFEQIGPYFPVLELQARWIIYVWSKVCHIPSREQIELGLATTRARRGQSQERLYNVLALQFARAAGVEPDLRDWPELARALLFGPLTGSSFRLTGPDSMPDAAKQFAIADAMFGAKSLQEFDLNQLALLIALAAARNDDTFTQFVNQIIPNDTPLSNFALPSDTFWLS